MTERRVVITGAGAVSAAGVGRDAYRSTISSSATCLAPITSFDTTGYPIRHGGEVPDFRPDAYLNRKMIARTARNTHFALIAADEALAEAGLDMELENPSMVGCIMGTIMGGGEYSERGLKNLFLKGPTFVSPFLCTTLQYNGPMAQIAIAHNMQGYTQTVANEMASGLDAIRVATQLLWDGELDAALVGGCEAPLWPGFICMFAGLGLHATDGDGSHPVYRPFDAAATGMVLGEGAALLMLEEEHHARSRGAAVLAEVAGYGATFDADASLAFDPSGTWYAAAMCKAMAMAGIGPDEVDVIMAEGRGSRVADKAEARAINRAFAGAAVPVTCVKGTVGHTLSAAGPLDVIWALDMMVDGSIPPIANLQQPIVAEAVDFVRHQARKADIRTVLLGARSLGGVNLAIVLRRTGA